MTKSTLILLSLISLLIYPEHDLRMQEVTYNGYSTHEVRMCRDKVVTMGMKHDYCKVQPIIIKPKL